MTRYARGRWVREDGGRAWDKGVDFANVTPGCRVLAVHFGGSDNKYGLNWIGPVTISDETFGLLEAWAADVLDVEGGYVHLLPADGDKLDELRQWITERVS
jgi:hypothetical protein